MTERKTCGTCGPDGGWCEWGDLMAASGNRCPMHVDFDSGECFMHVDYAQQCERADDAEHRLREALARLALRETLIDTLMRSGEVMAERNMQLEVALLRDEGGA